MSKVLVTLDYEELEYCAIAGVRRNIRAMQKQRKPRDKTPYDGIIMYEDNPQDILPSGEPNSTLDFVVFNNNQIKSADTRNNTFLLDSPDFRFEKGGLINKHL
jgi:hypothetical protein